MRPPTAIQLAVLRYIGASCSERGYPPTIREINVRFGWSLKSTSSHQHLRRLQRKGLIEIARGAARAMRITDHGKAVLAGTAESANG